MKKRSFSVNITPAERIGRVVIGLFGVLAASVLARDAGSTVAVLLLVLLALAGVDLVVTGATGHCPRYQKLGHIPRTLKGRTP